jgi:hypothetical protein
MQTRVVVTRDGNARTEVGDEITVIVNSAEKQVLMLMNSARSAHLMPQRSSVEKAEGLEWLDEVRRFQGVATRLPQPRIIDGHTAYGWKLSAGGMDLLMWATAEGVPLEMTMGQGEQLQFDFRFEMNVPLDANLFSTRVPEGYTLNALED